MTFNIGQPWVLHSFIIKQSLYEFLHYIPLPPSLYHCCGLWKLHWKRRELGKKMKDREIVTKGGDWLRCWETVRGGQWIGERFCVAVFSVKQLVMSRKGRISEEIRSKYHLPTYRSRAGFRGERVAQAVARPKKNWCFWPLAIEAKTIFRWKWTLHLQFFVYSKHTIFQPYAEPFLLYLALQNG